MQSNWLTVGFRFFITCDCPVFLDHLSRILLEFIGFDTSLNFTSTLYYDTTKVIHILFVAISHDHF